MRCERARELLERDAGDPPSPEEFRAAVAHVERCESCAASAADPARAGRLIGETAREPVPRSLRPRLRTALAQADADAGGRSPVRALRLVDGRALLRQAAAIAAACVLAAGVTWWLVHASMEQTRLEQDVLSAHVRSLLQDSQIQIASADTHTVKPWFTGRIDFAPDVKDLSAEGFNLVGGRLDYVGGRRVGALVYKRRLHTVTVFMWPSPSAPETPLHVTGRQGYSLLAWTHKGLAYWAISDLNAGELRQLHGLL